MVLLEHLNSFKAGVEHLIAGFLSPELVSPKELYRALREIEVKLQNLPNSDGVKLRMLRTKPYTSIPLEVRCNIGPFAVRWGMTYPTMF